MVMESPFKDYLGKTIKDGDFIIHPNGETGKVLFKDKQDPNDSWLVDYRDGTRLSRLCLQVGDKGMAILEKINE